MKVQEIHRWAFRLKLFSTPTKVIATQVGRAPDTVSIENTKYQLCLSVLKMRGELAERLIVEHHEPQTEEELREAIRLTEERIQRRASEIEQILVKAERRDRIFDKNTEFNG